MGAFIELQLVGLLAMGARLACRQVIIVIYCESTSSALNYFKLAIQALSFVTMDWRRVPASGENSLSGNQTWEGIYTRPGM